MNQTEYDLPYLFGDDTYNYIFTVKRNTFAYKTKYSNNVKQNIEWIIIPFYYKKISWFGKNIENNKKEKLQMIRKKRKNF